MIKEYTVFKSDSQTVKSQSMERIGPRAQQKYCSIPACDAYLHISLCTPISRGNPPSISHRASARWPPVLV